MKQRLLFAACLCILSSCNQYQYFTLSGENIAKNEKHVFVSDNDTLKVEYRFTDYKGKVGISVYNKSGQPLEVDWRRSAMIVEGKAYSFYTSNAVIGATLQRDSLSQHQNIDRFGNPAYLASIRGSVYIDQPTEFIPQASFIYKEPMVLPFQQLQNIPTTNAEKANVRLSQGVVVPYQKIYFEKDSSPVRFRSYLTLRIGNSGAQKEFSVEHNFYVSEVWKTASGPTDFPEDTIKRGDRFYLQP